jgi:hypothetical protein
MARDKRRPCRLSGAILATVLVCLSVVVYLEFAALKKSVLSALSVRATAAIGQHVGIADVSFHFPGSITVYGITVGNPREFPPGQLLRIKQISLDMKLRDLLSHTFHFNEIHVDSPEVTILRNEKGELNISDRLRRFFSGRSGSRYEIDNLRISSGIFSINRNDRTSLRRIDLALQNLSSGSGTKTTMEGSLGYAGNRISIEGWAYLGEEPRRFSISASARDFSPALFGEDLSQYGIDTKKARLDIDVGAKRDTKKGIEIRSAVSLKGAYVARFRSAADITLTSDSFFDIGNETVVVRDLSLHAGGVSEARLKGVIRDLRKNPAYTAELKIERLDLGELNFFSGLKLSGILTSGNLRVRGRMRGQVPEVSGPLFLSDASVASEGLAASRINAKVSLSLRKEFSFRAESTADITVAGKYGFERPAGLRLFLSGRGRPDRMTISSSAVLTPVEMAVRGKRFYAATVRLDTDGLFRNRSFSGYEEVQINDLAFGGRPAGSFAIRSRVELGKEKVELKKLSVRNGRVAAKAEAVEVRTFRGEAGYRLDIKDLTADYPAESAGTARLNLSLDLKNLGEAFSGSFGLSAERITYRGITGGPLEGSGRFDDDTFEADFSRIGLFGGLVKCVLEGRTKKGYFPLRINLSAEKVDMADVSKALSRFLKSPYDLPAGTGGVSFKGTLHSPEDLRGSSSFHLISLSASRRRDKRSLLKGADLTGKIVFAGKDLDFTADAVVGKVAAHARGDIKDFARKKRDVSIRVDVPAVRAADIRDSFWDIFPDVLLYDGLDGSLSAEFSADFTGDSLRLDGGVALKDFVLTGENGEYSIGPVNGTIPLTYRKAGKSAHGVFPTFDKTGFAGLRRYYRHWEATKGFDIINAGSLSYGFKLLDDIKVVVKPENGVLNIGKVSANIFGGTLEGSAVVGLSGGLEYRAGFIVDGLSLRKLCDNIGPIRGYISGKVGGVADFKSSGDGITGLIGKADFWTYATEDEKTMISKEFLRKVGGPAVKTYLGDRSFDKGIVDIYIRKGFLIFRDLEISHRNFLGIRDLSIKVAPFNNRIRIGDLLWSITEAAQRAKKE